MKPTRLLLHSGGLDSHIAWLIDRGRTPVWVDHGQENSTRERETLYRLAEYHDRDKVPFVATGIVGPDLGPMIQPDGHIAHRNLCLLLTVAMRFPDAVEIAYGALRGEASADKSPAFVRAASRVLSESEGRSITVEAPLLHFTKGQALRVAQAYPGAGALALTWSCYHNDGPCGQCQACYRRHLAEWTAGLRKDPPAALPTETKGWRANLAAMPLRRWPAAAAANMPAVRALLANRRSTR